MAKPALSCCFVLSLLILTFAPSVDAAEFPLPLVSGMHATQDGPFQPMTSAELTRISDADLATGQTHRSIFGEVYSGQLNGVVCRFDFSLAGITQLDSVQFTWTGRHEWAPGPNDLPRVRLDPAQFVPRAYVDFAATSSPVVRSGQLTVTGADLDLAVHDDQLSMWIESEFGTTDVPGWLWIQIETLEVTARAFGEGVPTPATAATWGELKARYRR